MAERLARVWSDMHGTVQSGKELLVSLLSNSGCLASQWQQATAGRCAKCLPSEIAQTIAPMLHAAHRSLEIAGREWSVLPGSLARKIRSHKYVGDTETCDGSSDPLLGLAVSAHILGFAA
jgi:hypothetical protein